MSKTCCCECGRPVPVESGRPGRCPVHPSAKRYSAGFVVKAFAAMRAAVEAAPAGGYSVRGESFWQVQDRRAAVAQGGAR